MSLKSFLIILLLGLFISDAAIAKHFPRGAHEVFIGNAKDVKTDSLKKIAPMVEKSIDNGKFPGAVILIGHRGKIIYRGIFGNRRILPDVAPMQFDTIFDIASLTKVVATTPAIMQLVEQGKLNLDDSVGKYWPEFAKHGKQKITIRELLTHTSGLPEGISPENATDALKQIEKITPNHAPGKHYRYSDVNFMVLAQIVKIISGKPFNQYVQTHIFEPLKMNNTSFLPSTTLRERIAPTELIDGKLRWGKVQDPIAYALGGVSGNAGLFSTAKDLSIYAQTLLNNGKLENKKHFLKSSTIEKMISVQTDKHISKKRGLGWDLAKSFSHHKNHTPHAFGHTGWTGTSLWMDPSTDTFIIILSSRVHPIATLHNPLIKTRKKVKNLVMASLID